MFLTDYGKKHIPGFGEVVKTEQDAHDFCKANDVHIVWDPRIKFGRYQFFEGYHFIRMNPKLSAAMMVWILWHEIAHFLLHSPSMCKFSKDRKRKIEREANHIAAICLMPDAVVESKTLGQIQEEFGYDKEIIMIRKEIYENDRLQRRLF